MLLGVTARTTIHVRMRCRAMRAHALAPFDTEHDLHADTFWGSAEAQRLRARADTAMLFDEAPAGSQLKHNCTAVGLGFDCVQVVGSDRSTGVFCMR